MPEAKIVSLSKSLNHSFSKDCIDSLKLIKDLGVEGDAHSGRTVKHRSRVAKDPTQPNLRQVHIIHQELLDTLNQNGFKVKPGNLGENITTQHLDVLSLPENTLLKIGQSIIKVTGLRNPCAQLDNFQEGLLNAVLDRDDKGNLIRKAGIMAIVLQGGIINIGDTINIEYPLKPHIALKKV